MILFCCAHKNMMAPEVDIICESFFFLLRGRVGGLFFLEGGGGGGSSNLAPSKLSTCCAVTYNVQAYVSIEFFTHFVQQ